MRSCQKRGTGKGAVEEHEKTDPGVKHCQIKVLLRSGDNTSLVEQKALPELVGGLLLGESVTWGSLGWCQCWCSAWRTHLLMVFVLWVLVTVTFFQGSSLKLIFIVHLPVGFPLSLG